MFATSPRKWGCRCWRKWWPLRYRGWDGIVWLDSERVQTPCEWYLESHVSGSELLEEIEGLDELLESTFIGFIGCCKLLRLPRLKKLRWHFNPIRRAVRTKNDFFVCYKQVIGIPQLLDSMLLKLSRFISYYSGPQNNKPTIAQLVERRTLAFADILRSVVQMRLVGHVVFF